VPVVARGIAEGEEKHVLGVWQGATENTTVVKGLLEDLVDRGLDLKRRYLVVIDGSKALRAGNPTNGSYRLLITYKYKANRQAVVQNSNFIPFFQTVADYQFFVGHCASNIDSRRRLAITSLKPIPKSMRQAISSTPFSLRRSAC